MKSDHSKSDLICIVAAVSVLMGIEVLDAQVTPTNQWVDFYSSNTIVLNGGPIAVGAVVDAYDPDGVHCGTYTVDTEGSYGFLHVYRDDATTTEDEGAIEGDKITFTIYGSPTNVAGPDDNMWTANGDAWQVDLQATVGLADEDLMPEGHMLYQNYPNPFNLITTLKYDLPERADVTITINDILGRQVRSLVNGMEEPGQKSAIWDGTNDLGQQVSAGVYLYTIKAGDFVQIRKMLLLK
ncbi:MAG: FlgD immunoglobulin-like domain containing protein [Candidatus Neomarinimicrobiota bacterium]